MAARDRTVASTSASIPDHPTGFRFGPDLLLPSMTLGTRDDNPSPLLGRAPLGPHIDGHLDVGHDFAREIGRWLRMMRF